MFGRVQGGLQVVAVALVQGLLEMVLRGRRIMVEAAVAAVQIMAALVVLAS